ncbi:hypothetical protein BTS2_2618 [Bacillus sp. TS-2]|nr:hypothetical protein BTS2_2618 [Bacillus sp. TS-2]
MTWKRAFFGLVLFIVLAFVALFIFIRVQLPDVPEQTEIPGTSIDGEMVMEMTSSRERINHLIQSFIEESNEPYQLFIGEQYVEYRSSIPILGNNVSFVAQLSPEITDSGGLLLYVENIQLGLFQLPASTILSWIDGQSEFPDWVYVEAANERLRIEISEFVIAENMMIAFSEFNIMEDQYRWELQLKNE